MRTAGTAGIANCRLSVRLRKGQLIGLETSERKYMSSQDEETSDSVATQEVEPEVAADQQIKRHWRFAESKEAKYFGDEPKYRRGEPLDIQICDSVRGMEWYKAFSNPEEQKAWVLEWMRKKNYSLGHINAVQNISALSLKIGYGELAPKDLGVSFPGIIARLDMRNAYMLPNWLESLEKAITIFIKRGMTVAPIRRGPKRQKKVVEADPIEEEANSYFDSIDGYFDAMLGEDGFIPIKKRVREYNYNGTEVVVDMRLDQKAWIKETMVEYKPAKLFYKMLEEFLDKVISFAGGGPAVPGYRHIEDKEAMSEFSRVLKAFMGSVKDRVKWLKTNVVVKSETSGRVSTKKAKPASEQVAKLLYLPKHEPSGVESIAPTKIPGAKALLVYHVEYNQISYFQASDPSVGLTVRDTKIEGYDEAQSFMRRLRDPDKFISMVKEKQTVKALKNYLEDLTTTRNPAKNRPTASVLLIGVG